VGAPLAYVLGISHTGDWRLDPGREACRQRLNHPVQAFVRPRADLFLLDPVERAHQPFVLRSQHTFDHREQLTGFMLGFR
jgi:hypothetical protein